MFSKYAWVIPLKKKNSKTVSEAFYSIFTYRKPIKLQTDKGKEFVNTSFQKLLKDRGIQFYVSQNENIKASVAECFNQTLKTKMWKYFTHQNTYKYLDVLKDKNIKWEIKYALAKREKCFKKVIYQTGKKKYSPSGKPFQRILRLID